MKSICFFSSFFNKEKIPYYIKIYLEETARHFTEVVFLTNDKTLLQEDLNYLEKKNILIRFYKNEGFDFGMWYKAFMEFPVISYDRVGLINDSGILFKKLDSVFDWINASDLDYCGLVDSQSISYHIQSYFLIINKNAIRPALDFFVKTGIVTGYNEVIKAYEIGLSSHFTKMGLKIGALYNRRHAIAERNPSFFIITDLINEGIPIIKKKIIFRSYRTGDYLTWLRTDFNIDPDYYIDRIKEVNKNSLIIDFSKAVKDAGYEQSYFSGYAYKLTLGLYKIAGKSVFLRYIFHKLIDVKRYYKIKF